MMSAKKTLFFGYTFASVLFLFFSYGFVDRNLHLSSHGLYKSIHEPLKYFVFEKRGWAGGVYIGFLAAFWILYYDLLKNIDKKRFSFDEIKILIVVVSTILLFSFPAFSYDIFNYMLTARVTFTHKENPWIVRPVEIPNEPALVYTRAANKRALYGPTWILATYIPHALGMNNVWVTLITFKLLVFGFYGGFLFLLWKTTKNLWNMAFFAFNPLVLITILNEGHNDIVMMTIVIYALVAVRSSFSIQRLVLWTASVLVKGGTIVLFPLFFLRHISLETCLVVSYWLLFAMFLITPLREEMYPWYFIWCLTMVSFLPRSRRFLYGLSISLCFGLLLRNTPYIVTRQYDGYNQIIRTAVTWVSVVIVLAVFFLRRKFSKHDIMTR